MSDNIAALGENNGFNALNFAKNFNLPTNLIYGQFEQENYLQCGKEVHSWVEKYIRRR
jgi:hypothetical protein